MDNGVCVLDGLFVKHYKSRLQAAELLVRLIPEPIDGAPMTPSLAAERRRTCSSGPHWTLTRMSSMEAGRRRRRRLLQPTEGSAAVKTG